MAALLASLAVAAIAMPLVLRILLKHRVMDLPTERSSHANPVPRGGGIACLAGVLSGLLLASSQDRLVPWLAVSGAVLLALVGLLDDRSSLAAAPRLGAQIAVGALVGFSVGGGWWILLGMICLPVAVNVVNFMDGINGITGLNMVAWGLVAMAVGYAQAAPSLEVIGAVTAGSTLAFLPWNAPVARLFLGDAGSYLLGALVGIGVLLGAYQTPSLVVLLAPLSIYLADTAAVLLRRAKRGEHLMTAHKQHIYQRLVSEVGLSHSIVAALTVGLALVITAAWVPGSLILGVSVTLVVLAGYLGSPYAVARTLKTPVPHSRIGGRDAYRDDQPVV